MQLSRLTVNPNNKPQQPERAEIYSYWANAKLSYPEQAHKLWSDVDREAGRS
jgi:hypothetical protein